MPLKERKLQGDADVQQAQDDRGGAPDFTALILTLLRLEKEQTDVLITINVRHIKGEYDEDEVDLELGKQGKSRTASRADSGSYL